jgi:hypothetical protein
MLLLPPAIGRVNELCSQVGIARQPLNGQHERVFFVARVE